MEDPAALRRQRLSGRVGAGLDACAAIAAPITLQPGETRELSFLLGIGRDLDDVHVLLARFSRCTLARVALAEVRHHWEDQLAGVRVVTPDAEIDLLVNGWLPYQVIACRMWARTGSYQSGGAFGFRDQLQDAMSLVHLQPGMLRDHLIRASARQFPEGDVQHWWHPPSGRGVRTHCSDDMLWLPAAAARYVKCVGDLSILDVRAPFLEGRPLRVDEEAYADVPTISHASATLYEHCVLAIRRALRFGAHGLPLMGSGDWNDGMNLVGARGEGESVWLAWFLHHVLRDFAEVARAHGDPTFADTCTTEAEGLAARTEASAWDGAWYRRAWFDTGEPLGSEVNTECQIDAIAQSWAVLSGAARPERAYAAMRALDERLVRRDLRAVLLLAPPFDVALPHPGYIRGYPPGVRENGGQYTHAAVWAAMAFARLGDWERAWELARMINPILHSATPEDRERYRVEPYVLAADVYAVEPHAGLGGWSWQTGSAGWMYTLIVESLLGLERSGDVLFVRPCVPPSWTTFTVHYRFGRTTYRVVARRAADGEPAGRLSLDGALLDTPGLPLVDDRQPHVAEVTWA
jgi:cellobiose phosphorylase